MSSTREMLIRLAKESNGKMRLVKVPEHMRPTPESMEKLDREIKSQIDSNDVMRYRSGINASKDFCK